MYLETVTSNPTYTCTFQPTLHPHTRW